MNAISAPLKRIREQLKAPAADQGHVSCLSYRAQRDLSLLKEHKSIKRGRPRIKLASLQQQQHSKPQSPMHMMNRFRYQPTSDERLGSPVAGTVSRAAQQQQQPQPQQQSPQQQPQPEADRHEDASPTRSRRDDGSTRAAKKLTRLPHRGASPEVEDPRPQQTDPKVVTSARRPPVWHRVLPHGSDIDALPEATCKELEAAVRAGRLAFTVKVDGRDMAVDLREGWLRDPATAETWELFRDDFGDVDFYGRKEYLARHRQADVVKMRQRREERRLKHLKHKAPAHCHIWHNPNSEEVSKIPCQFPANTLQHSLRAIVAFSAGARHVTTCNDAPGLEEALPRISLQIADARRGVSRKSSHRPAPGTFSDTAPEETEAAAQERDPAEHNQLPALAHGSPVSVTAAQAGSLSPAALSGRQPRTPAIRANVVAPAAEGSVWDATPPRDGDDVSEAPLTTPVPDSVHRLRCRDPTTPLPPGTEFATEDEEGAYHGHQLFANNFAGIRSLIAEMNKPGGLPRLEPPKDRARRKHGGDSERPRSGRDDGSKSPTSPTSKFSPSSQRAGSDSDDDWGAQSSDDDDSRPLQTAATKQRDLNSWQRQLMTWQGPLDLREDEEGSSSSGDDDYDPNCTICRMYDGRGPETTEARGWIRKENGGRMVYERQGDNPYLQKTQEWKSLVYSAKLRISLRLHDALDERQATKSYVMQSPSCIAQLGRAAETNARQWETGRFTSNPSPAQCIGAIPTIWNRASALLRLDRHRTAQCILLYSRLLWYLEKIGGPSTQGQVHLVNAVRRLLIRDHKVSKKLLFDVLREFGPDVVESRDNMKIMHYLRIELSISGHDLIRFIRRNKHKGWFLTRDLQILADKVKKREQTGKGGLR